MARLFILIVLIIGVVIVVSCSGAVPPPMPATQATAVTAPPTATTLPATAPAPPTATTLPTTAPVLPTATTQPTKAPSTAAPQTLTSSGGQQKLNLDDYFPKGAGRDLVLRDCTGCHSFVPIITGQRPKARWLSLKEDHKDKASGVNQADYDMEFAYLMENFNDTKPEPKLPDWFKQQQPGVGE